MSETKTKKKEKKTNPNKKGISKQAKTLILGFLILLIPVLVFGGVILSAYLANRNPVIGSRFAGDLDPAISSGQIETIKDNISKMSNIDKCDVQLTTSQLRINIDVSDSLNQEEIEKIVDEAYNQINNVCNINTYFSSTSEKKMYDLSISVYNFIDAKNEDMIYYILTKNSNMAEPSTQLVSEAQDEDLAKELRGELEVEETPGGENVSVSPEEIEENDNGEDQEQ